MTLVDRKDDTGVRSEADFFSFDDDALDWLGKVCGRRPIKNGQGLDTAKAVAKQIDNLSMFRVPKAFATFMKEELRLRIRRNLAKAASHVP